ncbi:MAG: YceI family protein [Runella slithyformis]|nr:MAG: YceI family protein [Runella slithyformis]TAF00431.1 MAG: YceI family protein [Runella slithyformis]TAF25268.1 MAG: YceI family protein [Runella slithyformis]TAF44427.1 MAG: YceI family protein [Runella slithyformis]TAF80133.1 MAG: YceI family protein [Runella slithyformis]
MKIDILWAAIVVIATTGAAHAQTPNLYTTNGGQTDFFSETPVENITAINKAGQCIINATTGEVVVRLNIKQFDFPNKLMQEHFNENYLESDKYPTAVFKGKINEKIDVSKDGSYDLTAPGTLTIHGVAKERTLKGKLDVKNGQLTLATDFDVALADHKIDVPKLVFVKIAQVIRVKNRYNLVPYQPKKLK